MNVLATTTELELEILGMTCASCARRLETALNALPGIETASVNSATDHALIRSNRPLAEIKAAIKSAGFSLAVEEISLPIKGMSCGSCVGRIEKALNSVAAVVSASVNLASESAQVEVLKGTSRQALVAAITAAGFTVPQNPSPVPSDTANGESLKTPAPSPAATPSKPRLNKIPFDRDSRNLLLAMLLTLPLVLPMLLAPIGVELWLPGWLQLALATPVQFWLGGHFYLAAWRALRAGAGNMDLLVALGTSAAFGLSLFQLSQGGQHAVEGHYYFESSAVVISLVMLGKWLEKRAKRQTTSALAALQALQPSQARRYRDGQETLVDIASIVTGDWVMVKPGERICVDGEVLEGQSHVDEALLSGESLGVARGPGEKVRSGSINGEGQILIRTEAVGNNTTLAQIIRLVASTQASKAPIQRLVDRVSAVFVPLLVCIALITFGCWWGLSGDVQRALLNAVAVLVVACPCALGLATPTAILVGTGVAARFGILIKNAESLESAFRIDTLAFDKTGTLTQGNARLVKLIAVQGDVPLLKLAASLQTASNHPLAKAVIEAAIGQGITIPPVVDGRALPGRGISGVVEGVPLQLGSHRLMDEQGIDTSALQGQALELEAEGHTLSWLAQTLPEGQPQLLGLLAFGDPVKASAAQAIQSLHRQGLRTLLLTGDNQGSADYVARLVGIKEVIANALPADKAQVITQLQADRRIVAMVGDGINDAPALAAADLGIAMGSGAEVAIHTAGITLMRNDPRLVADALAIACRTYGKIQQNLFWAFIYNLIGIPLAAFGYLNPMLAGAAMAFSSVSVVSNALLLKRWRPAAHA